MKTIQKLIFMVCIVGAGACAAVGVAAGECPGAGWRLKWSDEFDGTRLDTNVWQRCGAGSSDWNRHMSPRPDLVTVGNGYVTMRGVRNDGPDKDRHPWLTGGISNKFGPSVSHMARGKVLIRAKFQDHQKGAWPALWMCGVGKDAQGRGWPWNGEIDIVERLNGDAFVYHTVHSGWTLDKKHPNEPPHGGKAAIRNGDWNVYGMEITPSALIWSVNGKETLRYPRTNCGDSDQWPFDSPFFFLLDMQLGGKWVGNVNLDTLPVEMYIDYIRIYEKEKTCSADVFTLEGPAETLPFKQADFKWEVSPRHDYSRTYVTKLFLCQAEFDREHLGKFKMRDNGRQTVRMTCEQALEAIKAMDAITLGMPKIVYLVGWQYNGHDSKYPAFFEGNRAVARACDRDPLDSVRWLMREAKRYHTAVSVHVNLFDAFPDSPLFDEYRSQDVLAREKDGSYILGDWGYKVSYAAEWEKGLVQKRLDRLCALLPIREAGTLHVDAFHNHVPFPVRDANGRVSLRFRSPISPWHGHTREQDIEAKRRIVKYLDARGIDVTTEGVGGMDVGGGTRGYFPMYWHYNSRRHALSLQASQACGGNNHATKAFGENLNAEMLFMRHSNLERALDVFRTEFCKTTLVCQYLNTFRRKALVSGRDGGIGVFEDGVRTLHRGGRISVARDGVLLADGYDFFIPAVWLGDGAVVAFSEKGCRDRKWRIPRGLKLGAGAKGWRIDARGRTPFDGFRVAGGHVSLTLAPGEMVLVAEPSADAPRPANVPPLMRTFTGKDLGGVEEWEKVSALELLERFRQDGRRPAAAFPRAGEVQQCGSISYHLRKGRHFLALYDWDRYMDFAERGGLAPWTENK